MSRTVVGLFDNLQDAQATLHDLNNRGYAGNDISLVAADPHGEYARHYAARNEARDTGGEAAAGAATGAAIGGGLGLLAGLSALAIPGIGPIVALGTIGTVIAGAAAGAGIGGILGALTGMGLSKDEAGIYAEGVRRGGTLVTVQAIDEPNADRLRSVYKDHNVVDIDERVNKWREQGWTEYDPNAPAYTRDQWEQERQYPHAA